MTTTSDNSSNNNNNNTLCNIPTTPATTNSYAWNRYSGLPSHDTVYITSTQPQHRDLNSSVHTHFIRSESWTDLCIDTSCLEYLVPYPIRLPTRERLWCFILLAWLQVDQAKQYVVPADYFRHHSLHDVHPQERILSPIYARGSSPLAANGLSARCGNHQESSLSSSFGSNH